MKKILSILNYAGIVSFLFLFSSCQGLKVNQAPVPSDADIILFDGKSLDNWQPTDFAGKGEIFIDDNGSLVLEMGAELSDSIGKGKNCPNPIMKFPSRQNEPWGVTFSVD